MDYKNIIRILESTLNTILSEAKEPIIKVYAQSALDQTKFDRNRIKEEDLPRGTPMISCKEHKWFGEHYEKCPLCK